MSAETPYLIWLFGFVAGLFVGYFGLLTYARTVGAPPNQRPRALPFGALERTVTSDAIAVARKIGDPPAIGYVPNSTRVISDWRDQGPRRRIEQAYTFRVAVYGRPARDILIPSRYLARFISLETPARRFWYGKAQAYTDCVLVASSRMWIEEREDGANGWAWTHEMRTLARRVRRLEEERIYLPSPARVGEATES